MEPVNTNKVVSMLNRHEKIVHGVYPHIKFPFTTEDVDAFIRGEEGYTIELKFGTYGRSRQIQQAVGSVLLFCCLDYSTREDSAVKVLSCLLYRNRLARCSLSD